MSKVRDEKLLAAVRDRPVLYDQTMPVFRDSAVKNEAWRQVAVAVVGNQGKVDVERLKVRWKTLRDGFVWHLKKKRTLEMFTAAAATRPYKLEKHIEFLLPHVSFRDEDGDGDEEDDGGVGDEEHDGGVGDEDAAEDDDTRASSLTDVHHVLQQKTNDCDAAAATMFDHQHAVGAEMLYEQSVNIDRACSEHDALDRSTHFLCDQRYKASAAGYKLEDMDSVDAFFYAMAQTVKQLKPITVAKIKKAVSIIVSNAEIEEMEKK